MTIKSLLISSSLVLLLASPALAQTDAQQQLDRLQREMQILQKQIARGESVTPSETPGPVDNSIASVDNPAQLEVRLSGMDEEIRRLRGRVEESEFQVKKLTEQLDKLQKDTDFRFNEIAGGKASMPPATGEIIAKPTNGAAASEGTPAATADSEHYSSAKEQYNYGYLLVNQTKYDEAKKVFESFIKKYPDDPFVSNAYYWLGEIHYIKGDYVASADTFRQGFEAMPNGKKAPDNLFKLAMSLSALNRSKEACIVLSQIGTKFKKSPDATRVIEKVPNEQKRIGCK
jgi:tol-pal system protein YbgF